MTLQRYKKKHSEATKICTIWLCTMYYLFGDLVIWVIVPNAIVTFFSFAWPKEKKRKKSHRLRLVRCQKLCRLCFGGVKTRCAQTVTPLSRNTRSIFDALTDAESYYIGWGARKTRESRKTRKSRETRSIVGDIVFVPNGTNVEKALSGICFLSRMKTNVENCIIGWGTRKSRETRNTRKP